MTRLVFTCGDINGIGPEISVKTFNRIYKPGKRQIIFLCPQNVFLKTIHRITPNFEYQIISKKSFEIVDKGKIIVIDIGNATQKLGTPTIVSGRISYNAICDAVKLVQAGFVDAIITAPISKQAFNLACINFPGHTELLAKLSKTKNYLMFFLSPKMKCGLVTIHKPIKEIQQFITKAAVKNSLSILYQSLKKDFGISKPKIAVLGLNPHAGEDGKIGSEENEIIKPIIKNLKKIKPVGPFVPDAFFGNHLYKNYDAILGMYHDQVLIPFKMLNFNKGVNYTAGLPFVRTSPDHGTAFDIADKWIASEESMVQAVYWAETIVKNRNQ